MTITMAATATSSSEPKDESSSTSEGAPGCDEVLELDRKFALLLLMLALLARVRLLGVLLMLVTTAERDDAPLNDIVDHDDGALKTNQRPISH